MFVVHLVFGIGVGASGSGHRVTQPFDNQPFKAGLDCGGRGAQVQSTRRRLTTRPSSTAIAAAGGFVCGAACWHFVGFWAFLTDVVLFAPATSEAPLRGLARLPPRPPIETAACTTVARANFGGGYVRLGPCPSAAIRLRPASGLERSDLAIADRQAGAAPTAVLGWSTSIDVELKTERTLDGR